MIGNAKEVFEIGPVTSNISRMFESWKTGCINGAVARRMFKFGALTPSSGYIRLCRGLQRGSRRVFDV